MYNVFAKSSKTLRSPTSASVNTKEREKRPRSASTSPVGQQQKTIKIVSSDLELENMGLSSNDLSKIQNMLESVMEKKLSLVITQLQSTANQMKRIELQLRSKNVIIQGIAEHSGEDLTKQTELMDELCTKMGIPSVLIDDIFRIGKKVEGKQRPLLVKLVKSTDKRLLMMNAKKLKEKIYLNDDLTKEERDVEKILRNHFKVLKSSDASLRKSIRNGNMRIWKDGKMVQQVGLDEQGHPMDI